MCVCERASHVYCVRRVLKHTHTHTHIHTIKDKCQCPVITLLPLSIHLPPPVSPSLPRSVSTLQSLPIKRCLSEEPFIIRAEQHKQQTCHLKYFLRGGNLKRHQHACLCSLKTHFLKWMFEFFIDCSEIQQKAPEPLCTGGFFCASCLKYSSTA